VDQVRSFLPLEVSPNDGRRIRGFPMTIDRTGLLCRELQPMIMKRPLPTSLALFASCTLLHAQWVGGGVFSTVVHYQACAFHNVDSGFFAYGANNPGPLPTATEGGLVFTDDGNVSGGYYVWYAPSTNLEDIDVKMTAGLPLYMAAGHRLYNRSLVVRPYDFPAQPFAFDSIGTGNGQYYRAVRMRDDLVAFAAGGTNAGDGIIDMSADTGATWTNVAVLPGQPVSRLHFVNDQLAFAATGGYSRLVNNGLALPDSGAIYRTIDGGMSWQQVHASNVAGFSDVDFLDDQIGVATRNDGAMLRTTDGGDTWIPASVSISGNYVLTSVVFRGDGIGFASAYRPDGTEGLILISTDDGDHWGFNFSTASLNYARRIYDLYFFDEAHGHACSHYKPLRTTGIVMDVAAGVVRTAFGLFPNPGTDVVTVTLPNGACGLVEVLDATGRLVRTVRTGGGKATIDLCDLRPGSYVVRAHTIEGVLSAHFVRA